MKQEQTRYIAPILAAAISSCLLLAMAMSAAGPDDAAGIAVTSGRITWSPGLKAERWSLTISGQGIYREEVVESGDRLTLEIIAPDGERLPDGRYNWDLRAINPERSESALESRAKPASIRQRTSGRDSVFERRQVERPMVLDGSFRVERGAFVMPPAEIGESQHD
jgi:hypothetical protein